MKKKNVLLVAASAMLVAVLSIGGTLAYLTATDDAVVNTFQFANNLAVELTEPQPEPVGAEAITPNSNGGYDYTNLVPGQRVNKAPAVQATTTVPAYVFVRVTTEGTLILDDGLAEGEAYPWTWQKVQVPEGADPTTPAVEYLFGRYVDASDTAPVDVFRQVLIPENALEGTTTVELPDIKIEVSMIQAAGFEGSTDEEKYAAAYAEAEKHFKAVA